MHGFMYSKGNQIFLQPLKFGCTVQLIRSITVGVRPCNLVASIRDLGIPLGENSAEICALSGFCYGIEFCSDALL